MIWSISNSSGNHVVLESDVKKFCRNQEKNNNSDIPATVQEEKYNIANIILLMYNTDENIHSPQHSPILTEFIINKLNVLVSSLIIKVMVLAWKIYY